MAHAVRHPHRRAAVCHVAFNVLLLLIFNEYINLHRLSVIPAFLASLMFFQIALFNGNTKNDTASDTAYSIGNMIRLTDEEQKSQYSYLKHSFLLCVPFEVPLIFFLPSYCKMMGVFFYVCAYIIGGAVFKIKNGKAIQERINKEKKELEEQKKREELGLK